VLQTTTPLTIAELAGKEFVSTQIVGFPGFIPA